MVIDTPETTPKTFDVLLIDDHQGERTLVREALAFAAAHIVLHEAENAVQAFWFLAKQREYRDRPTPDLILLDLSMPVIDGKRVLEVLRRDDQWRRLPVLVLTNSQLDVDLGDCHELGASAFITKPSLWLDYLDLVKLIDSFLVKGVGPAPAACGKVKAHFFVHPE